MAAEPRHAAPGRLLAWRRPVLAATAATTAVGALLVSSPGLLGNLDPADRPTPRAAGRSDTASAPVVTPLAPTTPVPAPSGSDAPAVPPARTPEAASRSSRATTTPTPTPTGGRSTTPAGTPTRSSTPSPAASGWAASQGAEVVRLVNLERAAAGCAPLRVDARIARAAQLHSEDMAAQDYLSHTSRDGRTAADRMRAQGYPDGSAENIAAGQRNAVAVVRAWMDSAGHRANILDCDNRATGVGAARGGSYGTYWTQDFGRT